MSAVTGAPLLEVVRAHAGVLADAGVASPDADARALAAHVFGIGHAQVHAHVSQDRDAGRLRRLEELVARRAARVPLQHLTGDTGFRTLVLACRPGVFVPRPETEVLAGAAIEAARAVESPAVVVEPCTGTGAVALAVAAEVAGADVHATDLSADAVALARTNLDRIRRAPGLAPGASVAFRHGDLLEPLDRGLRGHVDVLVCNPPYLTPAEVAASEPEVRDHEPLDALVGGDDGDAVIGRLLAEAAAWLAPRGWLGLELSEFRADLAVARARGLGYRDVDVLDDLAGRERVLTAWAGGPS